VEARADATDGARCACEAVYGTLPTRTST
jgi:hypothetical protein